MNQRIPKDSSKMLIAIAVVRLVMRMNHVFFHLAELEHINVLVPGPTFYTCLALSLAVDIRS